VQSLKKTAVIVVLQGIQLLLVDYRTGFVLLPYRVAE